MAIKGIVFGLLSLVASLLSCFESHANVPAVCGTVKELGVCQYKSNSPERARYGDNSSPITGFNLNPTIIFTNERGNCGNPAKLGSANIYDSKGGLLCSGAQRLGCDARRGTCLARYKADPTTCNTRNVRRLAIKRTGSPTILWKVASNLCYRVPDAGKCYNVKVRELCGQTVK
jgi:hypothetical protein